MKGKGYRKIDNQYYLAILAADLTRAGTKVLLAVIHFTLGYNQRDAADISLTTFEELTGLSLPAIRTAIKELTAYDLISVATPATNRLPAVYKLNKDWRGKADFTPRGKADLPPGLPPDDAKTLPPDVENFTPRGKVAVPVTTPVKKERKPLKKRTATFEDYKKELRGRFPDLDFDLELEKFTLYWSEGTRKLRRPKSALLNWLDKAREFKARDAARGPGQSPGAQRRASSRRLPKVYRDVNEIYPPGPEDNPNE